MVSAILDVVHLPVLQSPKSLIQVSLLLKLLPAALCMFPIRELNSTFLLTYMARQWHHWPLMPKGLPSRLKQSLIHRIARAEPPKGCSCDSKVRCEGSVVGTVASKPGNIGYHVSDIKEQFRELTA